MGYLEYPAARERITTSSILDALIKRLRRREAMTKQQKLVIFMQYETARRNATQIIKNLDAIRKMEEVKK